MKVINQGEGGWEDPVLLRKVLERSQQQMSQGPRGEQVGGLDFDL